MNKGEHLVNDYRLASKHAKDRNEELNAVVENWYEAIKAYADGDQGGVGQKIDVTTLLKPLHDAMWQRK